MNPFLSKRFLLLTLFFAISLLMTFGFFVRDGTTPWQLQRHDLDGQKAIANYDWIRVFPTENGALLVTQRSSSSSYYSGYYSPYSMRKEYPFQVLYVDKQGLRFVMQSEDSFYNAVCEKSECTLFMREGYQRIHLDNLAVSEQAPWQDKQSSAISAIIVGNIYYSKREPAYIAVSNEHIFVSRDKGLKWDMFADVRELAKSYYPEEISGTSEFVYAINNGKVVMWYSYGHQMGSLEVVMSLENKQVISHRWLPMRINEAAQNQKGDIYVIAQEPSRKLYSLMQYQSNGHFELIAEGGYNGMRSLKVSNQGLVLSHRVRGEEQYLLMDFNDKQIQHRSALDIYNSVFNSADLSFMDIQSTYSDDLELKSGDLVSYQSLH